MSALLNKEKILAKAVFNVAQQLEIEQDRLFIILGISLPLLKSSNDDFKLDPLSQEGKRALSLIRIYQVLYTLCGGDVDWMRYFMNSNNVATKGIPIQQIETVNGLQIVLQYLDEVQIHV